MAYVVIVCVLLILVLGPIAAISLMSSYEVPPDDED